MKSVLGSANWLAAKNDQTKVTTIYIDKHQLIEINLRGILAKISKKKYI